MFFSEREIIKKWRQKNIFINGKTAEVFGFQTLTTLFFKWVRVVLF